MKLVLTIQLLNQDSQQNFSHLKEYEFWFCHGCVEGTSYRHVTSVSLCQIPENKNDMLGY